jgi:CRISPR system Cascade subunit CasE
MNRYGALSSDGWQTRDYTTVLKAVEPGRQFAFRLRANPVHSVSLPGQRAGERTKRLGHVTAAQQRQWFLKRAPSWGIDVGDEELPTMEIPERKLWSFKRHEHLVTVAMAVFEGRLRVVDSEVFRDRLIRGFGGAKAYGCGLLTLAPDRP